MPRPLRYVELFAGGGGLSLGLDRAGWQCVAHAEIEPHARAVLRMHWPDTPMYGDVVAWSSGRRLRKRIAAAYRGHVDVVSGGSPCQDMSVAGKRAGLAGARSSLFFHQVRWWRLLDATYFLWENVLGALSSNAGRDFAAVLSALVGATIAVPSDGWQRGGVAAGRDAVAAWRVLDLQHFGPPQRRLRVFVVAARTGACDPAEILAVGEGVCGHPSPREQARKGIARNTGARTRGSGGLGTDSDINDGVEAVPLQEVGKRTGVSTSDTRCGVGIGAPGDSMYTLQAGAQHGVVQTPVDGGRSHGAGDSYDNTPIVVALWGREGGSQAEVSTEVPALRTPGGGSSHPLVISGAHVTPRANRSRPREIAPSLDGAASNVLTFGAQNSSAQGDSVSDEVTPSLDKSKVPAVVCATGDVAHALTHEGADASEDGTGRGTPIVIGNSGMESWRETLTAITLAARDAKGTNNVVVGAHDFGGHGGSYNGQDAYQNRLRAEQGRPRRLTPRECERLMGWSDDFTRYGVREDGSRYELSDTARYRICGNGVGSACSEWIGRQMSHAVSALGAN